MEIVQQDDGNTALSALTNTHLVEILNSANLKDSLPLAENFILSRVSDLHFLYMAQVGIGFRLPSKAAFKGCGRIGTQASINLVPTSP